MPDSIASLLKYPKHIAIIMDGNGRWAKQRHLPRVLGHQEGVKAVREVIKACVELDIEVLTLFAFSRENWQRPTQEVDYLMTLFLNTLKSELNKLVKNNVQLRVVGCLDRFTRSLRNWVKKSQTLTEKNIGLKLIIAVNYSGRWDIVQAIKKIAKQIKSDELDPDALTQDLVAHYLSLSDLPPPDLLIRTSGEYRISNFLLWQLAYTELYFTDTLWPDFNKAEFYRALLFYARRERRFGATSEQLIDINA